MSRDFLHLLVSKDQDEAICPPCVAGQHWNHETADGIGPCRSIDRVHNQECACSWHCPTTGEAALLEVLFGA